jgi:ubiquinone/menaquinone biosynthesis C-methylase UbiE
MIEFDQTLWAEREYAQEYRDNADHYVQERATLYKILVSFYRHFVGAGQGKRALDLGCGDGALAQQLLLADPTVELTLLDGSPDMLASTRRRFHQQANAQYILSTFEAVIEGTTPLPIFDFIG